MLYGAQRAQQVILTHPNHEHLLRVLEQTKKQLMAGEKFGGDAPDSGIVSDNSGSWPSDRQNATNSSFDDDALLTDDEINRQNQGGSALYEVN